jgi:poly-beta-1,6-N-acetyl-D-glucosamine synthase
LAFRIVNGPEVPGRGSRGSGLYSASATALAGVAFFSSCRWCVLLLFAFAARRRQRRGHITGHFDWPFVSIFVPSYNEHATIEAALLALIQLDYPRYEVIVVNDGSTDDTLERASRFEGRHGGCHVRVIDKPNGGKWSAHNLAFQRSTGELILCIDADSRLCPQSLRMMVARMADPHIDGIAGQMRVRNRNRLITRLQGLEYLIANGAVRTGQGLFGTVLIVPGPIGMFRRSVLEEVWLRYTSPYALESPRAVTGPFEGDTFAEDFDLSLAILSLGGNIVYEPRAISFTNAPERPFTLVNQRYRWTRGAIQVLRKFLRRARNNPRLLSPRLLGWLGMTCALDVTLLPLLHYFGLGFVLMLVVAGGNIPLLLGMYGAMLLVQLSAAAWFVSLHDDRMELLRVLPAYTLYTSLLLPGAWLISVIDEIRGKSMRW